MRTCSTTSPMSSVSTCPISLAFQHITTSRLILRHHITGPQVLLSLSRQHHHSSSNKRTRNGITRVICVSPSSATLACKRTTSRPVDRMPICTRMSPKLSNNTISTSSNRRCLLVAILHRQEESHNNHPLVSLAVSPTPEWVTRPTVALPLPRRMRRREMQVPMSSVRPGPIRIRWAMCVVCRSLSRARPAPSPRRATCPIVRPRIARVRHNRTGHSNRLSHKPPNVHHRPRPVRCPFNGQLSHHRRRWCRSTRSRTFNRTCWI